jgi:hypothetical protein
MSKKVRRGTKIEISENVVFSEQYSGQPNGGEGGALDQQTVRMAPACHPPFWFQSALITWHNGPSRTGYIPSHALETSPPGCLAYQPDLGGSKLETRGKLAAFTILWNFAPKPAARLQLLWSIPSSSSSSSSSSVGLSTRSLESISVPCTRYPPRYHPGMI